jgi:DNA primase
MQLASFFWEILRRRPSSTPPDGRKSLSIADHKIQKVLLGMLVHYPEFLEEKLSAMERIQFDGVLERFRSALYDLLIVHGDVSVQLIYKNLGEEFYFVLEQVHGKQDGERRWGHRLFQLFPILRIDPPRDFVSKCIDHFIERMHLAYLTQDIEALRAAVLKPGFDEELAERMVHLVRIYQVESERLKTDDMALAEWATEIRRVALGPEAYSPVAA